MPSIFLSGATGYIGGSILNSLLSLPSPPESITCLLRDPTKSSRLSSLSTPKTKVIPFIGSYSPQDLPALTEEISKYPVVIETASADDVPGIQAIISGMRIYHQKHGQKVVFIHTSGTGALQTDDRGEIEGKDIYTDALNPEKVLPGTIWGKPEGKVYEIGVANDTSIQIPKLVEMAVRRGQAGYVGKGENVWVHIHIQDCADLYTLLYTLIISGHPVPHGAEGYYFCVAGEYRIRDAAIAIGESLSAHGLAKEGATTFTDEELDVLFPGKTFKWYLSTNSRAIAPKSLSLGWKTDRTSLKGFLEDCKSEAVRIGKKTKGV
ncbi:hypothetical protein TREMEDRAFT_61098 [Tremella mesenterica DSM 1558]|uniref:uncharacterized protein n=1 Tax=Tremella mesenterica (strain ATCC 24925 / CBS 8224 / DSM 1558 / NBRC 9311 / NRRL Y-6157 / RJB 2259-6 / UBC 559-6) TaxID=578456 RepID=UPI0003F49D37|nr:uncharacterized protein TREMEDRAFT_61098 [Tremella mesenterica DSM 1558]EIW70594.1 hypothetical protein TREMEDRAFT_61098 [Tremella mesenterica DSM 1558]